MLNLIKERIQKEIKEYKRKKEATLRDIAYHQQKKLEDPHNIKNLAFHSSDEGRIIIRSTNLKRVDSLYIIQNVQTIKVVDGKAQLLNNIDKKVYWPKDRKTGRTGNTVLGSMGFIKH